MSVYYNEFDAFAAAWLRELMSEGVIPQGDVDTRSIVDVRASDLAGYKQCHFFAGIGGWAYALQLAGWGARSVWTGSCPCQPFSAAGKRRGNADERHLWPVWFDLIRQCRPDVVVGEQVEAAIRMGWLDGIRADLEGEGYALGAAVLGAHSVSAPHIRQRLYWLADADGIGARTAAEDVQARQSEPRRDQRDGGLADADGGIAGHGHLQPGGQHGQQSQDGGTGLGLEHAPRDGREPRRLDAEAPRSAATSGGAGFWSNAEWLACSDGKARRVEPGIFPLAHGVPNRVGTLRGAGNAIVPQVAAEFIQAYLDL